MSDDKKMNLPAIKKGGALSVSKNRMQPLNLGKNSTISKILSGTHSVQAEIARKEQGLDLILVGDLTTSMTQYHELLKEQFSKLCVDLFPLIKNLRIGIIFYLDHDAHLPYVTQVSKLSRNSEELHNFIRKTPVLHDGNSTNDEAMECAFQDIVNMNWREIGNRSVVLFGDARPHEPEECPKQRDYFDLTRKMYENNIIINSVYCGSPRYSDEMLQKLEDVKIGDFSKRVSRLNHPNFFSWVANVTGGMVIGVEQVDDLIEIIQAAAAKDSGNMKEYEEKLKLRAPQKLKLAKIAKQANQRRIEAKTKFNLPSK